MTLLFSILWTHLKMFLERYDLSMMGFISLFMLGGGLFWLIAGVSEYKPTNPAPIKPEPQNPDLSETEPIKFSGERPSDLLVDQHLKCWSYSIPKEMESPENNEDAFMGNLDQHRFAIADGVSGSYFARNWAQLLVAAFIEKEVSYLDLQNWVISLCPKWYQMIDWEKLEGDRKNWHVEHMKGEGARSTFLGLSLEFEPLCDISKPHRWRALAVGDSCLFHVQDNRLIHAFPIDRADGFSNTPQVLSSVEKKNLGVPMVQWTEGICQAKDVFLLITDALAKWFLHRLDKGETPWVELLAIKDQDEFKGFISRLRVNGCLKNDDTTLAIINLTTI